MKDSVEIQSSPENSIPIIVHPNGSNPTASPTSFSPTLTTLSSSIPPPPPPISTPHRHSRQSSTSSIYSNSSSILTPAPPTPILNHHESRGRQASLTNKLNSSANPQLPTKFAGPMSNVEIFDALEKEQEAMVNKLQREIHHLKSERSRSRSQSTSSSSSMSRNPSIRSIYSVSDAEDQQSHSNSNITSHRRGSRPSFGSSGISDENNNILYSLRKENEALKKKLADLSIKCMCS